MIRIRLGGSGIIVRHSLDATVELFHMLSSSHFSGRPAGIILGDYDFLVTLALGARSNFWFISQDSFRSTAFRLS